jgi:hypothetical protein
MDSIPDLDVAVADLQKVFDYGLLNELRRDIAFGMQGRSRDDFEAFPWLRAKVDYFAQLLVEFTGMPLQLCELAAIRHLLPECRSRNALDILHRLAEKLRADEEQARTTNVLAAERRRVAGGRN